MIHIPFSRMLSLLVEEKKLKKQLRKEHYNFSDFRFSMIRRETDDWKNNYLPISVKNKTVIDFGAGQGETSRFFINNGALMVIAVEPSDFDYDYLIQNSYSKPIYPIREYFSFELMAHLVQIYKADFIKIDIEGFEEELLFNEMLPIPTVVEIHGLQQIKKFKQAGWYVKEPNNIAGCVTYAYWGIKYFDF